MYRVFWQIPQRVLCLELAGELSLADFDQINKEVIAHLGIESFTPGERMALLVDITRPCRPPGNFTQLKISQTYAARRDLNFILVAGNDKFMRLMTLLTFNLSRPMLKFFDNTQQALDFVQEKRGP